MPALQAVPGWSLDISAAVDRLVADPAVPAVSRVAWRPSAAAGHLAAPPAVRLSALSAGLARSAADVRPVAAVLCPAAGSASPAAAGRAGPGREQRSAAAAPADCRGSD